MRVRLSFCGYHGFGSDKRRWIFNGKSPDRSPLYTGETEKTPDKRRHKQVSYPGFTALVGKLNPGHILTIDPLPYET
jgi:hypothetical protein